MESDTDTDTSTDYFSEPDASATQQLDYIYAQRNAIFQANIKEMTENKIKVGDRFNNKDELIDRLQTTCLLENCKYRLINSNKTRFSVQCDSNHDPPCKWSLHASNIYNGCFQVKASNSTHTCDRLYTDRNRHATQQWIANRIKHQLENTNGAEYKPRSIIRDLVHHYRVHIKYQKAHSARAIALEQLNGSYAESYADLRAYCHALTLSSTGNKAIVTAKEGTNQFKYLFIAYEPCLSAFSSCRNLIFLDTCHLKGRYKGQLFVATTLDGNDQIIPLAYFIAEEESEYFWTKFLRYLFTELDARKESNSWPPQDLTIISDRAKGLINAVTEVFPDAHHGFCCRHLCVNFIKGYRSTITGWDVKRIKSTFWNLARAKSKDTFQDLLSKLREKSTAAASYLWDEVSPSYWADAYFEGKRYQHYASNPAESINNKLLAARADMPIVLALEQIREGIVNWFYERNIKAMSRLASQLTPRIEERITAICNDARAILAPVYSSNAIGDVTDPFNGERFMVNLQTRTCACNVWTLSGLPCVHASAMIMRITSGSGIGSSDIRQWPWIEDIFRCSKLQKVYEHGINPVPPKTQWPQLPADELQKPAIKPPGF